MKVFIRNPVTGEAIPVFSGSSKTPLPLIPESSDCRMDEILSEEVFGDLAVQEGQMEQIRKVLASAEVHSFYLWHNLSPVIFIHF
jgi:hypothetical protein